MRATGPLLTLTALALLLPVLPDLLRPAHHQALTRSTQASAGPGAAIQRQDPSLQPLALLQHGLLERLQEADREWIPQAEDLPGGGTRYLYKRRPGDPELTIPQIRALMKRPPTYGEEQRAILSLLTILDKVGAGVGLIEPIKSGAAAEWDPQARTLRIRPDVPDQGTVEFARVLNHEAIHVAQSCAAGGIGANPRPLGLQHATERHGENRSGRSGPPQSGRAGDAEPIRQLDDPVYANLSPRERRMEEEAYNLQNRLDIGLRLIQLHCLDGQA